VTEVGKYKILSKLSEGGMGAVYIAVHPTLNRKVILKQLTLKGSSAFSERFKREARMMMDFRDEHIVQVYDHFKEKNSYYIVMEFVEGMTLADLIQQKRYLSNEAALLILREIAKGLKYAHDKNVIHRDIKPANILISKEGKIKLTDFGIATSIEDTDQGLTQEGTALGTPAYMSPEQISDTKKVDHTTDIYSMGVMLYEMTTGQKPFPGNFSIESIGLISKGKYTHPRKINSRISGSTQSIIQKAMHCKAKKRFKTTEHLESRLSRYLSKYKEQEEINLAIKNYIEKDELTVAEKIKKKAAGFTLKISSNLFKILFILLFSFTAMGIGGYFFYKNGYYYELFKEKEYGAMDITLKFNKEYREPDQFYIKAMLLTENGKGKFSPVKDIAFNFQEDQLKEDKIYYYLRSDKVYLPAGNYRLQIFTENQQYTEDFYLNPRISQKDKRETFEARTFNLDIEATTPLPLTFNYKIRNLETQEDITKDTELRVYLHKLKGWWSWESISSHSNFKELFTTASEYTFQFKKDGFFTRKVFVSVKPYETILNLVVDLVPVPGTLQLKTDTEGLSVLINFENHYFTGGYNRSYTKIEKTKAGTQKFHLSPGIYTLTIKKNAFFDSNTVSAVEKIEIQPEKTLQMTVKYDKEKEKIEIK